MKFSYNFSNLFGTVYHKGNLLFSSDGQTLISPVGNRITLYDLKRHKSDTLPIESRYNFTSLALSPNGLLLVAVNEPGEALICSLPHRTIVHRFHFKRPVSTVKFSPDGRYLAVAMENKLFVYQAPNCNVKQFNPFVLEKVYSFSYDKTLCIDWTSGSKAIAVGSVDMTTKIYAFGFYKHLSVYTLGSHSDSIIGCFFEENSLNLYTVSKNGQVCVWDCSIGLEDLVPLTREERRKLRKNSDDEENEVDKTNDATEKDTPETNFFYKRVGRYHIKDAVKSKDFVYLSSVAYHRRLHLLVAGFSNGSFLLYEMPACNQIHSLSLSNQVIASLDFNQSGDWIAVGSEGIGQLVVWEWQSESFVLKQQGHFNNMQCLAYAPDGMYIATGGEDGKVKLWDTSTGFCFVTFTEHSSAISGVAFAQNGKVVLSSSLDGTVRAFDLHRYRNFRTFTSPKPVQFSCLTIDPSGEVICAGSQENFEVYMWAMPTGHLLSILSGHQAPVSGVCFSPTDLIVASVSWDKTLKLWNVRGSKTKHETIHLSSDGLCVVYRPDGNELAVATLDGQISFFDPKTSDQTGNIEGRHDLYVGRRETDMITPGKLLKSQAFTTLSYTADGECILAAGRSKFVCIYNVKERLLLKKFKITCNLSFDAIEDFINRRKMTDFGNKALIEERRENISTIPVPGSKKIDNSSRTFKPEINVTSIQFSPTGQAWAATSTEGLLVYSLNNNLVFDPFDLDVENTPDNIRKTLKDGEYSHAIMMAFRLNEDKIIREVIESISPENIETLSSYLPVFYVEKMLRFCVEELESSPHFEFYVMWVHAFLTHHGTHFRSNARSNMSSLRAMQKVLTRRLEEVGRMHNSFKYFLDYALTLGHIKKRKNEVLLENPDVSENILMASRADENSDYDEEM